MFSCVVVVTCCLAFFFVVSLTLVGGFSGWFAVVVGGFCGVVFGWLRG